MKNIFKIVMLMLVLNVGVSSVFAGGLPEDETDLARELAQTQNDLQDQKGRADDLQGKLDKLQQQVDDLAAREPQTIIEKTITSLGDESPVHIYADTVYSDSDVLGANGTFDQQAVNVTYTYKHEEDYIFFADIGFLNGAEFSIDNGNVNSGSGDVSVAEVWLDWKVMEDNNLTVRFGKFYTPFGVWMPDEIAHSTVSINNPLIVNWAIVPTYTTGIREYGEYKIGDLTFSQTFYIGNGKSAKPHSDDSNTDKAIGARFALMMPFGDNDGCTFGISGYLDRDGNDVNNYQEKVYGIDARVDLGPITFRSETLKSRLNSANFSSTEEGHVWKYVWFSQLSYNFLEKYDLFYRYDFGDNNFRVDDDGDVNVNSYGISYRPVPPVVFKAEFARYDVDDEEAAGNSSLGKYEVTSAQVAVKF